MKFCFISSLSALWDQLVYRDLMLSTLQIYPISQDEKSNMPKKLSSEKSRGWWSKRLVLVYIGLYGVGKERSCLTSNNNRSTLRDGW